MSKQKLNQIDVHVGGRIRARRKMLGQSQTWLGDKMGLTFQQIQKYEKGVNRVGGSRLLDIADALEVTPAYFFESMPGEKGKRRATDADTALREFTTDTAGVRILRAWPDLPDRIKTIVAAVTEELVAAHVGRG